MGHLGVAILATTVLLSVGRTVLAEGKGGASPGARPAPPTGGALAPPTGGAVAPPTGGAVAPPTDGALAPPTDARPDPPSAAAAAPVPVAPPVEARDAPGPLWEAGTGPVPLEERTRAPRRHWYGWETLLVDGVWVLGGLVTLNDNGRHAAFAEVLIADYFLGPPIVHLAHGQVGTAFGSLGLRLTGPLLIVAGAASLFGNRSSDDSGVGLVVLGVLTIPAAVAIDASVLARETVTSDEASLAGRRIGLSPWADPRRRAGGVSLTLAM